MTFRSSALKGIGGTVNRIFSSKTNSVASRTLSVLPPRRIETEEFTVFPFEYEGNDYDVNWSLVDDGVTPTKDAYRNGRIKLLTSRLAEKPSKDGKVTLTKPKYNGAFTIVEAGDGIEHDDFQEILEGQQDKLSDQDLFVEDASLGSYRPHRIGTRIVTNEASTALILRTLLMNTPTEAVDHRARFTGWNFDPRWKCDMIDLDDEVPVRVVPEDQEPQPGQRPIAAFIGCHEGDKIGIQYVQNKNMGSEAIVGANIIAGNDAPILGIVKAINQAACVVLNEQAPSTISVPSISFSSKNGDTTIVIGADDSVVNAVSATAASGKVTLHSAYGNLIAAEGVSGLWNGVIGPSGLASTFKHTSDDFGGLQLPPVVEVNNMVAVPVNCDNLINPVTKVIFYEKGNKKAKLSSEEGFTHFMNVAELEEEKTDLVKSLLKDVKFGKVGSASDVVN